MFPQTNGSASQPTKVNIMAHPSTNPSRGGPAYQQQYQAPVMIPQPSMSPGPPNAQQQQRAYFPRGIPRLQRGPPPTAAQMPSPSPPMYLPFMQPQVPGGENFAPQVPVIYPRPQMPSQHFQTFSVPPYHPQFRQQYYPQQQAPQYMLQPQQLQLQQQQPQMQQPATQQMQPPTRQLERPASKRIIIRNPDDNRDITDEVLNTRPRRSSTSNSQGSTSASAGGSNAGTPPMPHGEDAVKGDSNTIGAQFAAQVAATLTDSSKGDASRKKQGSPDVIKPEAKKPEVVKPDVIQSDTVPSEKSTTDESTVPTKLSTLDVIDGTQDAVEVEKTAAVVVEQKDTSAAEVAVAEAEPSKTDEQNLQTENVKEKELVNGSHEVKEVEPVKETVEEKTEEPVQEVVPETVQEESKEEKVEKKEALETPEEVTEAPQETKKDVEVTETVEEKTAKQEEVTTTNENGVSQEDSAKPEPMKEMPSKKKKKQKFKEMDKKSEAMQGDLMGAFIDKPVKDEDPAPSPPPTSEPEKAEKEEEVTENGPETAQSDDETWEDKDEEKIEEELKSAEDKKTKTYGRDFLLGLQFSPACIEKPEGLPKIDIILDAPQPKKQFSNNRIPNTGHDFLPNFARRGMPAGGTNRKNNSGMREKAKKIIAPAPVVHTEELKRSENRWIRPTEKAKNVPEEEKKSEELYRLVTGILNKLTPQKFQTLTQQIVELDIDTSERLQGVIDRIFEKALAEPTFSQAYANMCRFMLSKKVLAEGCTKDSPNQTYVTFRKLLLNKCQKEFEKESNYENAHVDRAAKLEELSKTLSPAEYNVKKEEMELEESKAKRRTIGNIRFIGELFKLDMLTENIMHDCVIKLLRSNDEESFECLCSLLLTIGKKLDHEKAKLRIDQYFEQIKKIIAAKKISARIRFLLQDVVDLRERDWVPRREDNNPKTIDQIHKEAQIEEEKMLNAVSRSRTKERGGRDSNQRVGLPPAEDGWTVQGGKSRGAGSMPINPDKFKNIQRAPMDETIQLGPGGRSGHPNIWNQGSSGGGGGMRQSSEPENKQSNRFNALSSNEPSRYEPRRPSGGRQVGSNQSRGPGQDRNRRAEREKALEAAKEITGGEVQEQRAAPPQKKEQRTEAPSKTPPRLTEEQIQRKATSTLEEYLNVLDMPEAVECVRELQSPDMLNIFVASNMNHTIEKKAEARVNTGKLHSELITKGLLSAQEYIKGLKEVLVVADDIEPDVPKVWRYIGELVEPLLASSALSLSSLKDSIKLVDYKAGTLLSELLNVVVETKGKDFVKEIWSNSGLDWSEFVEKNVPDFVKSKKLEFTLESGVSSSKLSSKQHSAKVQEELRKLMAQKAESADNQNEIIIEWIETNIEKSNRRESSFIRDLVTVVCENSLKGDGDDIQCDGTKLSTWKNILRRYIDSSLQLQIQSIFALQSLAVKRSHPPELLKSLVDALYNEEIIQENAFYEWEKDNSQEQDGKGAALASLSEFFIFLRNAPEESPEE